MSASDFLGRLVRALRDARVPFMVTGSFASSYHGAPRTSQDIDVVVELTSDSLDRLLALLPASRYYVSRDAAREALFRRSQFNVVDFDTGWKADLIVRKDRPWSREELRRREPALLHGVDAFVASAEDTILAKLEWARMSGSDLQLRDVGAIIAVQAERLDRGYVESRAEDLGVSDLWKKLAGE